MTTTHVTGRKMTRDEARGVLRNVSTDQPTVSESNFWSAINNGSQLLAQLREGKTESADVINGINNYFGVPGLVMFIGPDIQLGENFAGNRYTVNTSKLASIAQGISAATGTGPGIVSPTGEQNT